eukprot:EG_transcript_8225
MCKAPHICSPLLRQGLQDSRSALGVRPAMPRRKPSDAESTSTAARVLQGTRGNAAKGSALTFWPSANSRAAWPQSRTPCCSRTRKPAGRAVAGESYLSSSFIQCAGKGVQKEGVQKSFKKKRALLADGILQLCGHPPRRSRWTPAMGELHFTTKCQNMKVCVGWPLLQPYKKKLSRKPP